MGAIKLDTFGGMVPAADERLLPDRAAAHSENTWLYSGRLSGIPQQSFIRDCTPGTGKVYRIPTNYIDTDHISDSIWMEFANPDTDVVRALVIDDKHDRYYWASSSLPPQYSTRARIAAGEPPWLLGIPQPAKPGLKIVPNTEDDDTDEETSRAYLTTWVSAYGEEGPVSTPVLGTGMTTDLWRITLAAPDPNDLGGPGADRYLTHSRIYRTVTSQQGVGTYFLVAEIPITQLTYDDILTDEVVTGNNILESAAWTGPPADLQGLTSMPNGILAGWRKNELWFSEPFRPHAWPVAYVLAVDFPVVGLGVTNQTLVVCTQGYPFTASGIHPASIALSKSASLEPCQSRGSILSTTDGVFYASPNGLIHAGMGTINNITRVLITKDKWATLTQVVTLRAARLGTAYYGFGSAQAGVFDPLSFDPLSFTQENSKGAYTGLLLDAADQRVAFNLLSDTTPVTSVQNDPWSGEILIIKKDKLYFINLSVLDPIRQVFLWRSKIFQATAERNFSALKVYWDAPPAPPNPTIDEPAETIPPHLVEFPHITADAPLGVVRVICDDRVVLTRKLRESGEMIRLPSGFKASYYQLEFETYVDIRSLQLASSVKALASV